MQISTYAMFSIFKVVMLNVVRIMLVSILSKAASIRTTVIKIKAFTRWCEPSTSVCEAFICTVLPGSNAFYFDIIEIRYCMEITIQPQHI